MNKCLKRIYNILWFDRVNNERILNFKSTQQNKIGIEIEKCKWGWIGHRL